MTVFAMEFNLDNAAFWVTDRETECNCQGYRPEDPAMHGDTAEDCPVHDPNYLMNHLDFHAIAAMLDQTSANLGEGISEGTIRDINGNTIGSYGIVP